MARSAFIAHRI